MTMSDQIIAVLDNICAKFGVAIDWTSENVLPYVIELAGKFIKYEIATSVFWCLGFITLSFASYKICKWCWGKYNENQMSYDWEMTAIFSTIFAIIMVIVMVAVVLCQILDIVTCVTFPEKAIFDYISTMMKTA